MQKSHRSVSSAVELRQAIVAMMNRKDELEEQNTYVRIHSSYLLLANFQMLHHTHVLRLEELLLWASRGDLIDAKKGLSMLKVKGQY